MLTTDYSLVRSLGIIGNLKKYISFIVTGLKVIRQVADELLYGPSLLNDKLRRSNIRSCFHVLNLPLAAVTLSMWSKEVLVPFKEAIVCKRK